MSEKNRIQLKTTTFTCVPFQIYEQDFTFIVNGKEFKTNRLIADLLSPKISQNHFNDPTLDTYIINTQYDGDFSHIFDLLNFKENEFPVTEYPFIFDVLESLGNEHIQFYKEVNDITINNVFDLVEQHEKFDQFYSKSLKNEIDFISKNFSQICDNLIEKFRNLSIDTILSVISNENLQLKDEDQLLKFVNDLYFFDSKYSPLYEKVQFVNLSKKSIKEFIEIFNYSDISHETWQKISERLLLNQTKSGIEISEEGTTFSIEETKLFSGVINYLMNKTKGNQINITSSSFLSNNNQYHPRNVVLNDENEDKCFLSENNINSWICFEFKDISVHPTDYIIRSPKFSLTNHYIRNWVIEGSNDNIQWTTLDTQNDCDFLNGSGFIHTFKINDDNIGYFQFIRLRQTGPNVFNQDFLAIKNFEIYGKIK